MILILLEENFRNHLVYLSTLVFFKISKLLIKLIWEGLFYWHKDNDHNNSLPINRQSIYIGGLIH